MIALSIIMLVMTSQNITSSLVSLFILTLSALLAMCLPHTSLGVAPLGLIHIPLATPNGVLMDPVKLI